MSGIWRRSCPTPTLVCGMLHTHTHTHGGTQWRSWLRHCTTCWKVAGSIPVGVTGIFHRHNPSGHTTALGSTQPLKEMSTRNISWGVKAAGAYGWQPYHLHVPTVLKSRSLILLETSRPVQICNGISLSLYIWGNLRLLLAMHQLVRLFHLSTSVLGQISTMHCPHKSHKQHYVIQPLWLTCRYCRNKYEICVCSSGILHNVQRQFLTDVSEQPVGPVFKGQYIQGDLTLVDGSDRSSRNVSKELPLYAV